MAASTPAWAQSTTSTAISLLPVISVVVPASLAGAVLSKLAEVPAALAVSGAVLTVKAVQASAQGTVYLLERAGDGATASVLMTTGVLGGASAIAGTALVVTVIASGAILSAGGEAIAFVPNSAGQALLYSERLI